MKFHFNLFLFNFLIWQPIHSWTGYTSEFNKNNFNFSKYSEECKIYYRTSLSAVFYGKDNKYGLWPNLVNSYQLKHGKILFGFEEAIEAIWKNQNPPDCKTAKFMISRGWSSGFGSRMHVEGSGFTEALNSGRVYLMHTGGMDWITQNSHCNKQKVHSFECYYLPWSKCTLHDAMDAKTVAVDYYNDPNSASSKTVFLRHDHHKGPFQKIPDMFSSMLHCSPIQPKFYYYWWRAVTASYVLRPNEATMKALDQYRTFPIGDENTVANNERCMAIYVRQGDKVVKEMKILHWKDFHTVAEYMWDHGLVQNKHIKDHNKLHYFFGTETPSVLNEVIKWSKTTNTTLYYTNLFDRSVVAAAHSQHKSKSNAHHDLEYLSMLLNLEYSLKCDAWVCTIMSNWCRVIDELRATVGGKANYHYADISKETCSAIPCMDGKGITTFEW